MTIGNPDLVDPTAAAAGIFPDRAVHQPQQGAQPLRWLWWAPGSPGWPAWWSSSGRSAMKTWPNTRWLRRSTGCRPAIPGCRLACSRPALGGDAVLCRLDGVDDLHLQRRLTTISVSRQAIMISPVCRRTARRSRKTRHTHTGPVDRADVFALLCADQPVRLCHVHPGGQR